MSTRTSSLPTTPALKEAASKIKRACDEYYAEAAKLDGVHLQMLRAYGKDHNDGKTISLVLIVPNDHSGEEVLDTLAVSCARVLDVLREWTMLQEALTNDNRRQ